MANLQEVKRTNISPQSLQKMPSKGDQQLQPWTLNVSTPAPTPPAARSGSFVEMQKGSRPALSTHRLRNAQATGGEGFPLDSPCLPLPALSPQNAQLSAFREQPGERRDRIPPPANHSQQALLLFPSPGPAPNEHVSTSTLLSPPQRPTAACPDGFQPAAAHTLCSEWELQRAGQAARTAVAGDARPNQDAF